MDRLSIFDIAGPIMVGPSSSHTAGACKIGQFARALFHKTPKKATFYLHGSFGEVFKGHATDKALLGGVMKFRTSDERMGKSFKIAKEKKLAFTFKIKNLGKKYHPNTVKIVLENGRKKMSMIGSSVGGGVIEILQIDNVDIHIKGRVGKYQSVIVCYKTGKKILEKIKTKIKEMGIRIVDISTSSYSNDCISVISLEKKRIKLPEVIEIEKMEGVEFARALSKLEKQ